MVGSKNRTLSRDVGPGHGWFGMGLIETLDFNSADHPRRGELIAILQRLAEQSRRCRTRRQRWWQLSISRPREEYRDHPPRRCSRSFCSKASRLGYIDERYGIAARRAYDGILKEFIEVDPSGLVNITKAVAVVGSAAIRKRALSRRHVRVLRDRKSARQRSESR